MLDWTGLKSEKFDYGFYIGSSAPAYIGGPVANNSLGGAWQFTVAAETTIDYLKVSGSAFTTNRGITDLDVYFKIYDTTRVSEHWGTGPDINSLVFESQPWHVEVESNGRVDTFTLEDETIGFGVNLSPGEYWFAQERGFSDSGPIVSPQVEFHSLDAHLIHTPEPLTLTLFGLGGIGLLARKRNEANRKTS